MTKILYHRNGALLMRKMLIGLVFAVTFMSGCSSGEPKISDTDEFNISGYRIKTETAKIEDDNLVLTIKWSFGNDEDSMKQENFAATGIIISANQNGEQLEEELTDSGIYKDVYEMNESTIYPSFKLLNEKDSVELIFNSELASESKKITITLDK